MDKREKYKKAIDEILDLLSEAEKSQENEQSLMKKLLQTQYISSKTLLDTVEDEDILPVNVSEMSNEVYDCISFATAFHYNKTYDCSPQAIEKLEKCLEHRQYIQNDKLEEKIRLYISQYKEHHNAWEFVYENYHTLEYRLTVLSKLDVRDHFDPRWEKSPDVPMYRRQLDYQEICGLIASHMFSNSKGDKHLTEKEFYKSLVKMRIANIEKNEWYQIFLGSDIGWKPVQFRVIGDFKR